MDAPPTTDDVRPWLRIRDLLEGGGVRVPRVLEQDVAQGFLLLEDLGGPTLAQVIDADNADAHFDDAIGQLLKLQAIAPPAGMGDFGEALLQRDAGLFEEWFLRRHLGLQLDCVGSDRLELKFHTPVLDGDLFIYLLQQGKFEIKTGPEYTPVFAKHRNNIDVSLIYGDKTAKNNHHDDQDQPIRV